jgi:hypothetical protein
MTRLVGSEMCIRDSSRVYLPKKGRKLFILELETYNEGGTFSF